MSILSSLDGGDLHKTLEKHRTRKHWLTQAEEWIRSDRELVTLTSYDISWGAFPGFQFDIPRAIWEPQLRIQLEEARRQVYELDRIVREYMEAALKL